MATSRVGIREFRDKLASYLLESEAPVAITRHCDTVGYYIPARRKRSDSERDALQQVAVKMPQMLAAQGVSEEDVVADFKSWRKAGSK
jgi:PHD/YefM family antitoxin component YafN of YafNO toxin-antitoxin module